MLTQHFSRCFSQCRDQDSTTVAEQVCQLGPPSRAQARFRRGPYLNKPEPCFGLSPHLKFGCFAQMKIYERALQRCDCHVRLFGTSRATCPGAANKSFTELMGTILFKESHRIRSASGAMLHLRNHLIRFVKYERHLFGRRFWNGLEGSSRIWVHHHAVLDVHSEFGHAFRHIENVMIVDSDDYDGIDLDHHAGVFQRLDRRQLSLEE